MSQVSHSERLQYTSREALDTSTDHDDLLTLTIAKNHLGVFSDTTDDDLITQLIIIAIEQVEAFLGEVLLSRSVVDYYSGFNRRYQLSSKQVTTASTITLKHTEKDGTETSITSDLAFDKSTERLSVYHTSDLPTAELSGYVMNPVSLTYTSDIRSRVIGTATQAVLYLVNEFYFNRGEVIANIDYRHVWKLLTPYKNIVG